ncbi:putative UDP-glucuronate:xylan alpha-glucuronosyltransferase 5 [Juglans microcarpa x Juglans regia]|uniref:putative UDP-glucuronate:xylan alpha-glucuronosyltransferase 5 n=1 Tax=Juglans microcarpa x Juglans regia TaxID=2249226 RepID=UPI001B7E3DA2|nr:putative UDP-glucuronate:xylan alpha-glucuronosyltransferase 5 [Juglans microcarpa x Juglans regia]
MASKPFFSSKLPKPFLLTYLLFLCLALLFLVLSSRPKPNPSASHQLLQNKVEVPVNGFDDHNIVAEKTKFKVGLVNVDHHDDRIATAYELLGLKVSQTATVHVGFERVAENLKWEDFFPEWIDEDEKWGPPKCPEIPMPRLEDYDELDVVIARVPCGMVKEMIIKEAGIRDVFRLQVNLVVANLVVGSGGRWGRHDVNRTVQVMFIGTCGPMVEIFRCDDVVRQEGDYWVYKPELRRLKQKVLMPFGSCELAPAPYTQTTGKDVGMRHAINSQYSTQWELHNSHAYHQREAYVTVLHSSEAYVCGAIALAQSIIQSNSTKDLVLLADNSISSNSIRGLRAAGWKIKRIQRILSPFAKKGSYNEWNYSKLRVWQLTEYDKVIFIDADLLVLQNIDKFFAHPQLSAAPNDKVIFNSGVAVIEPSMCMFKDLLQKRFKLGSYNGGDQGFLNEVFTWWHRLPKKLNHLKVYGGKKAGEEDHQHEMPKDVYAVHYLGLKPWMCYKDYDCNWDMLDHHPFASDSAHRRWWKVYEAMPKSLQPYCGLTAKMDARIRKWRGRAREAGFPDGHWRIMVKDRRRRHYVQ